MQSGHVPLHRRGTSRKYERMEDLLREAGYKETRIFTPPERPDVEPEADDKTVRDHDSQSGGVLGFIAGLVSRSASVTRSHSPTAELDYSPPASPSPLARKLSRGFMTSTPPPTSTLPTPPTSASSFEANGRRNMRKIHDLQTNSHALSPPPLRRPNSTYSEASRAKAYLRHMVSAPNIQPQRPQRVKSNDSSRPPMPRAWLETVARAVLFGGQDAHIGGPTIALPGSCSPPSRQRLGHSQSIKSTRRIVAPLCPGRTAPPRTEVSLTRVVCRSAPASRSTSLSASRSGRLSIKGSQSNLDQRGRTSQPKGEVPPSLARTRAENDGWAWRRVDRGVGHMQLSDAWGVDPDPEEERDHTLNAEPSQDITLSDDEEAEGDSGELDLSRLLAAPPPPKRQASIRSLRRHLVNGSGRLANRAVPVDKDDEEECGEEVWRGLQEPSSTAAPTSGRERGRMRMRLPVWGS